ncbi:MAG TPA: terminase, partial [Gammaproteobacteria bacterium]|nr:terminase [Gammaproteobacteria bacterium]
MGPGELLRWQWQAYPGNHVTRVILLLHIFTVPFFWAGTVLMLLALLSLSWPPLIFGSVCILV